MKTITQLTCLILMLTTIAYSQKPTTPQSLLWEIKGDGIEPSFLFGTFHMMPQEDFEIKDKVALAFSMADKIALEIDMDDPNMQTELMKGAFMSDGHTIQTYVDSNEYVILSDYVQSHLGMNIDQLKTLKPFFLTTLMAMQYMGGQNASYEGSFVQMAAAAQKEIVGLETVADQLAIFDAISFEEQMDDIIRMVAEEDEMKALLRSMIDLYKAEDVDGLYDSMDEYMDNDEDKKKLLLSDRNHKWIPRIATLSAQESIFYGVGAGHLGGPQGVIQVLRDAGYTVTPILE